MSGRGFGGGRGSGRGFGGGGRGGGFGGRGGGRGGFGGGGRGGKIKIVNTKLFDVFRLLAGTTRESRSCRRGIS